MKAKMRGQGGILWNLLPVVRLFFLSIGKGWNHFYGWMLDLQERKNSIDTVLKRGRQRHEPGKDKGLYDISRGDYHARYLQKHGLQPHHKILDFGFGYGRTGIPLLRYLEPGRYIGVELSAERCRLAQEWTALEGLDEKAPQWLVQFDNSLPYLDDESIDFMWAQGVLTHMPLKEIEILLSGAHRVLKPDGRFLFNFGRSFDQKSHTSNVKDYSHQPEVIKDLAEKAGFKVEWLDDWQDDLDAEFRAKNIAALKLSKNAGQKS